MEVPVKSSQGPFEASDDGAGRSRTHHLDNAYLGKKFTEPVKYTGNGNDRATRDPERYLVPERKVWEAECVQLDHSFDAILD